MNGITYVICDECGEPVTNDDIPTHACPDPTHDPYEPWMDPDSIDDTDEEVGA